ncbi:unnamed protein product [Linum tenue]|uniref:Uncharacterized protein n=1 Tax=Linum tenue TaxID=586396 RepID=A0AAV0N6X6_9ROSI|nr:unnamed protein product [Linum tenue]
MSLLCLGAAKMERKCLKSMLPLDKHKRNPGRRMQFLTPKRSNFIHVGQ